MCLIVDANVAHTFDFPPHDDAVPILKWLLNPHSFAMLVVGGDLTDELLRSGEPIRNLLTQLNRAGRLRIVDRKILDIEQEKVKTLLKADGIDKKMNDPHIIAIARVSGSRLLFSRDSKSLLHEIFKTRKYLKPPGKIYQTREHAELLRSSPKCKPIK